MDKALDLGINFFDTANVYVGNWAKASRNRSLGRWLAQGGGRREKVVLATKVYNEMGKWPNESKLSALHIRKACEDSLRRLQTDHIDLYQMHHIDRSSPGRKSGRRWSYSSNKASHLRGPAVTSLAGTSPGAQETAMARHFLGLVSEQSLYTSMPA